MHIDDILIETDQAGFIFVQAKTGLTLSTNPDSDLGKTADQLVRLWLACATGQRKRGWDRPLQLGRDRVLLAVGANASGNVSVKLANALTAAGAAGSAPLPQDQQATKDLFVSHLQRVWQQIEGHAPDDSTIDQLLRITSIISFDFGGADRTAAAEMVAHVLARPAEATGALDVLTKLCAELMSKRLGADASGFRQVVC
jgi:hypothetical protein